MKPRLRYAVCLRPPLAREWAADIDAARRLGFDRGILVSRPEEHVTLHAERLTNRVTRVSRIGHDFVLIAYQRMGGS